jgi:hypothetical protein
LLAVRSDQKQDRRTIEETLKDIRERKKVKREEQEEGEGGGSK